MTTTTIQQDLYPTRTGDEPGAPFDREHRTVWGSVEDGPFGSEELDAHAKRGFSILPEFISGEEIELYSSELRRLSADPELEGDPRVVAEKSTGAVRTVFEVTKLSEAIDALSRDPRVLDRARQLLGSEVYLHQTRVNYMPGFKGSGFYWHSDFETWHAEDGMPLPRAVSCSIALTPNYPYNGGLMVMPGSHLTYAPGVGETPADNHASSLKEQKVGVPSEEAVTQMAHRYGIDQFTGPAGSALWFDSNIMHGSGNNITPFPRSNVFMVFNSVENTLGDPYAAPAPRPEYIASRDFSPLR
ncbi:ectoine hydroxylase [Ruania suaedae]|uniref:ectoine hydroxylase n=1 Tax=Ruania suaedae TaxID=2897774 RepID=UPI001E483E30|nr:ectoine hydroxylase [Ruania suaedae]UFU04057.1 ectoine hydroxylase [Ruania suaedae]